VKSDRSILSHIGESIAAVETNVASGREVFLRERMIQAAVIRLLEGPEDS
jgi:hypothetical protein